MSRLQAIIAVSTIVLAILANIFTVIRVTNLLEHRLTILETVQNRVLEVRLVDVEKNLQKIDSKLDAVLVARLD